MTSATGQRLHRDVVHLASTGAATDDLGVGETSASSLSSNARGCARRVVDNVREDVCFSCGARDRVAPEHIPAAHGVSAAAAIVLPLCASCARRQIASLSRGWWWSAVAPCLFAGIALLLADALVLRSAWPAFFVCVTGVMLSASALLLTRRLRERAAPMIVVGEECRRPLLQVPLFSAPLTPSGRAFSPLSATTAAVSWTLGVVVALPIVWLAWLHGHPLLILDNPRPVACQVVLQGEDDPNARALGAGETYGLAADERRSLRVRPGERRISLHCDDGSNAVVNGHVRAGDVSLLSTDRDVCYGSRWSLTTRGSRTTSSTLPVATKGRLLAFAGNSVWREACGPTPGPLPRP